MTPIIVDTLAIPAGAVVDYQRVARGSLDTITASFASAPSPNTATVTLTRDDGTILVSTPATAGTGGAFSYPLLAAHTATLDLLTATWTSSLGTVTTIVEVVDGFLFEVAAVKALSGLANKTTAQITAARVVAETALEDACQVAFRPRYFRERIDGNGNVDLMLPMMRPLTVTAITVDGAAATTVDMQVYLDGRLYRSAGWPKGRRNITVTGTHGYPFPPPPVGQAALKLARWYLIDSPISDRATSLTTEDGATQFFVTAGVRQAVFDIPACNAVVAEYGMRIGIV